ncbi:hypothetical protein OG223_53455 [Streptomyces sp. NBC_01478]|uniref:hypothetical protein n=1 Tax=Streptomyces sp. NBC_01478 TaxID=2903882 RepID=UPI002E334E9A|nr:hypothetical protein [Streptomyces sp. NBC_01478]
MSIARLTPASSGPVAPSTAAPPLSRWWPEIMAVLLVDAVVYVAMLAAPDVGRCFVIAPSQVIGERAIETFATNDEQRALLTTGAGNSRIYGPDGSPMGKTLDEYAEPACSRPTANCVPPA